LKPITLILQPSKILAVLLVCSGLFFTVLLLLVPAPLLLQVILLLMILVATSYFVLRDALLKLSWSWKMVALDKAGKWKFTQQDGLDISVNILPDSFVSAYLTVLHVTPLNHRWFEIWQHRYVLLLQGNTKAEFFRKLRVSLLWGRYIKENPHSAMADDV
jgi:toxin CptA